MDNGAAVEVTVDILQTPLSSAITLTCLQVPPSPMKEVPALVSVTE